MAKAVLWACADAEERKRGERSGLDTLVVHALGAHSVIANYRSLGVSSLQSR